MRRLFGSLLLVCLLAATVPAGGTHMPGDTSDCPPEVECSENPTNGSADTPDGPVVSLIVDGFFTIFGLLL